MNQPQLPNIPYFNPLLQAPQSLDPRLQQRQENSSWNSRNTPLLPSQSWGPTNPQAFIPEHLQQRPTNYKQEEPLQWSPWISQQQQSYNPPDWSILSMPTSTRGHLSDKTSPIRSQGPPQFIQEQTQQNPLLQWERPQDPRFMENNQTHQRFENKHEITDIWKRAEMVKSETAHHVNDDAIRLTRGLHTR